MSESKVESVSLKARVSVAGALLGAFMAVLNIQVVNTSLPDIQGGIGTGLDNGGWISTAYLIGEIIVIPLSGWLMGVFSLRRYLIANTILFLFFSAACGLVSNFPEMVVLRALQGFSGGVLIPLSLVCVITLLPERARPLGFSMFALTATFAPAIGPTVGGWITDEYGWRYIFFLNLVPGAAMLPALFWGLRREPMHLDRLWRGDWFGVFTMALGLGALQTVLEEGNKDDWFGSSFITRLSIISFVSLSLFLFQEFRPGNKAPLVNLRLLTRWNFCFSTIANFMLGFVLYAAVYLIPLYLAEAHGYSARQSGLVMAWIGLPQLLIIPCMPWLMRRIDPRRLLSFGFLMFFISLLMNLNLGPNDSGPQLLIPNLIRAVGQAMVFPPITMIATAGISAADAGSASALFNMLRNLGGAVGIATVETFVTNREKFHSFIINQHVSLLEPATRERLAAMQQYFQAHGLANAGSARQQAIVLLGNTLRQQANYFAYGDAFGLLAAGMLIAFLASLFIRRIAGPAAPGGH
ncbi:MAG: multidrug efflux MFS transporter [Rhodospirillales bacterium]|nr:multidrug efflux MFS transporter [Rhodospirillales bacterium]